MRTRTVWIVLGLLWVASGADAGWFGRGEKLPNPVDHPIVRPKVQEAHKYGNRARHPGKYQASSWGRPWKQVFGAHEAHFPHSIFQK